MPKIAKATVVEELDKTIGKYHLLKHPFYRAWTSGKLSRESMALYAEQYYQHVKAFPENLRRLADRADDELRAVVNENLAEELDARNPHPALWRQFAHAMGVEDAALDSAKPLPGVAALLDAYDDLAGYATKAQAVAALYAYESQVPEIAAQKITGLRRFYGITEPSALAYFAVHEEADIRHRAAWRQWLAKQTDEEKVGILAAAERGLKALWGALDAVFPQGCAAAAN